MGGGETVSLFSFPISFVFDGPGLFSYWQSIFYVFLGFGGLFYSAVATRRQPKSLDVRGAGERWVDPLRPRTRPAEGEGFKV